MESTDGMYRILVNGTTLYVAFEAMDDTSLGFGDVAYFAFTRGTAATGAYAVKITADSTTAPVAGPAPGVPKDPTLPVKNDAGYVDWFDTTNVTGATPTWTPHPGAIPPWMSDVATWRSSPSVGWGITFKIDLTAAGVAGDMRIFHGMTVDHGGSVGVLTLATPVTAATAAASVHGDTIIPTSSGTFCDDNDADTLPNNDCWQKFSAPGTACTAGITFTSTDVGVFAGSSLTNAIQACGGAGHPCPTDGSSITNKFRVNLHNVPSLGVTAHAVRAHIRLADWGSTIADPNAPWVEIPSFTPNVFTAQQSVLTGDTSWSWTYDSTTHDATIDYTCKAGPNDFCPKLSSTESHQCMLVELGKAPVVGPDFGKFVRAAVYRNMDFSGLSSLDRVATVSLKGLKKVTGEDKDRDVYLHVTKKNMPPHGDKPLWLASEAMVQTARYAADPPAMPLTLNDKELRTRAQSPEIRELLKRATAQQQAPAAPAPATPAGVAVRPPPKGVIALPPMGAEVALIPVLAYPTMSAHQALTTVWPTYEVKTYYDTGKTYTVKGESRRVLQPMAPFGLYLAHDGALYGFSESIEALDGVRLEQIAPDWYVARKVKSESSFRVRAKVAAEETPKSGGVAVTPPPGGPPSGNGPCPTCGQCPDCKVQKGSCNCVVGRDTAGGVSALVAALAFALGLGLRRKRR
jgi:MYXO-CTERM domain-containing protein